MTSTPNEILVIKPGQLIDGQGSPPVQGHAVAVRGNRITWCGPAEQAGDPAGPVEDGPINVSALKCNGIDALRDHLKSALGYASPPEGAMTARRRHLQSLAGAREHFEKARHALEQYAAGELMAEELLQVQNALAEITGEFHNDDLLGRIFASFCVGK